MSAHHNSNHKNGAVKNGLTFGALIAALCAARLGCRLTALGSDCFFLGMTIYP